MDKITLRDYQLDSINKISLNFKNGIKRQILQLPTGAGKTITFAALVKRFISVFNKQVVICVHREELLSQTRSALFNHFEIYATAIEAGNKAKPTQVNVAMVETLNNRLRKNDNYFDNTGLLIVDECHIGNFKKIYKYFENCLIVGVSATPIPAKKNDPMKNHFDRIISPVSIKQLINSNNLSPNVTYSMKSVSPSDLKMTRGDYDIKQMSDLYSKSKNLNNTIKAYNKFCKGEKTIIFNCNVAHSKLLNDQFVKAGLNSRHLDGSSADRKEILKWFKNNDDAILNNIGVLTTGFDEPTIKNVIVNRSTMSLPLWLQMTGRASRPSKGKDFFKIIDMGGNVFTHNDWSFNHDWNEIFKNPPKPSKGGGVAPVRECDNCEAIIPVQKLECSFCGYVHKKAIEKYDTAEMKLELITSNINIFEIDNLSKSRNFKDWAAFFIILNKYERHLKGKTISKKDFDVYLSSFESMIKKWRNINKKKYTKQVQLFAKCEFSKKIKINN